MEVAARKKLKQFLEDKFCFESLKKAGFFKGIRKNDYEGQALRICTFFGYKSIYEYKKVCQGAICDGNGCQGDHPRCKSYNSLKGWLSCPSVQVNEVELITEDKWLN